MMRLPATSSTNQIGSSLPQTQANVARANTEPLSPTSNATSPKMGMKTVPVQGQGIAGVQLVERNAAMAAQLEALKAFAINGKSTISLTYVLNLIFIKCQHLAMN